MNTNHSTIIVDIFHLHSTHGFLIYTYKQLIKPFYVYVAMVSEQKKWVNMQNPNMSIPLDIMNKMCLQKSPYGKSVIPSDSSDWIYE